MRRVDRVVCAVERVCVAKPKRLVEVKQGYVGNQREVGATHVGTRVDTQ